MAKTLTRYYHIALLDSGAFGNLLVDLLEFEASLCPSSPWSLCTRAQTSSIDSSARNFWSICAHLHATYPNWVWKAPCRILSCSWKPFAYRRNQISCSTFRCAPWLRGPNSLRDWCLHRGSQLGTIAFVPAEVALRSNSLRFLIPLNLEAAPVC